MQNYQRLRDAREDRELTQQKIADVLMVKRGVYNRYEVGKVEMPIRHYKTLARFYGISVDFLCGLVDYEKKL